MADALDAVLAMRKEKAKREEVLGAGIAGGVQSGIDNFIKARQLQNQTQNVDINRLLAEAKLKNAQTSAENTALQQKLLNTFLKQGSSSVGNFPPGTTLKAGPLTIPLNQKLTESQTSAVAGFNKFDALVKTVESKVNEGVLDKGPSRLFRQTLAEGGGDPLRRLLTKDDTPLEELASAAAELKKLSFSEGGKQLSPTEERIVSVGLTFVGKGNKAIVRDFRAAMEILRQKKVLALEGSSGATKLNTSDVSKMSDEELQKIVAGGP